MTGAPGGQISGTENLRGTPVSMPAVRRQEAADRLAAFRHRTAGRGGAVGGRTAGGGTG